MKRLLFLGIIIGISSPILAQTCAQTLRLARATYEQGRLHEIEEQLRNCLKPVEQGGFSKDEKQLRVDAYKILCLSFIYLEEPQKADEAMLNLKRTDPYYEPNTAVDPAEFVALYNTFRKDPVYRIGPILGANFTQPRIIESNTVIELGADSEYKQLLGLQFGISFDMPLNVFNTKRLTLHGQLMYQQNRFEIDLKEERPDPNDPGFFLQSSFEGIESQNWVSLPVTLEYKLAEKKFNPYVALGVSTDYLLKSEITGQRLRDGQPSVSEKTEEFTAQRERLNISAVAAGGVKLPIGGGYVVFEARYTYGLTNVSSQETAFANQSLALDYGYADSIFKLSSLSITGAYVFNKFNPKKLIKRK